MCRERGREPGALCSGTAIEVALNPATLGPARLLSPEPKTDASTCWMESWMPRVTVSENAAVFPNDPTHGRLSRGLFYPGGARRREQPLQCLRESERPVQVPAP